MLYCDRRWDHIPIEISAAGFQNISGLYSLFNWKGAMMPFSPPSRWLFNNPVSTLRHCLCHKVFLLQYVLAFICLTSTLQYISSFMFILCWGKNSSIFNFFAKQPYYFFGWNPSHWHPCYPMRHSVFRHSLKAASCGKARYSTYTERRQTI